MDYQDILIRNEVLTPRSIRPKQKVLLLRKAKDGVLRGFIGTVNYLRVTGKPVVSLSVTDCFENSIPKRIKPKDTEFALDSLVTVYLAEDIRSSQKEDLINRRKLYAQNRASFMQQRAVSVDQFSVLGLTQQSSLDELSKTKKKLMLKWHPDRMLHSDLAPNVFRAKSKEITDALSYVEEFLTKKYSR